jgi:hypothetical protein
MKRTIIIAVVIAAIAGVIALKKSNSTKPEGTDSGACPCKMITAAQSNQTESGTAEVE